MPYLCFIFIHFTFFSLLLIPSLYSWLTSGQFGFSLLFPALFCCSAQSSPSYPPCLLQLPEIISRLTPFPWRALMYVDGGWGGGGGFRQATNAPRAIFKSHFTLLRVKRPDTALCEGRRKKTGGEEGKERVRMRGVVRDGKEMMVKTALKVEEESKGTWRGRGRDWCWRGDTYSLAKEAKKEKRESGSREWVLLRQF